MPIRLLFTALAMLTFVGPLPARADATSEVKQLFEDDWEFNLKENPTFASFQGDRRYDANLPAVSEADEKRRARKDAEFLERLHKIDRSALSPEDQLNYDLFELGKTNQLSEFEFRTYLMPISNRSGFHVSFPQLPDRLRFKTVSDYENFIARLDGFKPYTEAHIELMQIGIRDGYVLPKIVLVGVEGSIEPHVVKNPRESLLYKPFEDFPENFSEEERARLAMEGRRAITESVVPAYREFLAFITKEYVPAGRDEIGASALPNGREFYKHRVRRYTTLDKTPEEIHAIGESEVIRIRAEMQEVIDEVKFEGTFAGFVEFLRTDERFYVDDPEQLMKEVAVVLKRMDGELPGLFSKLPRMSYGIKKIPDFIAPKTTTAYYNRPAGDGSRAGYYFVNTYDLPSRPLYEIEALSLHEAVPGHHLQIALQQELENIPNFRRFSGFTAFVEGWALYSERLGLEVGFYEDPYSNFGRLTYEMWRACRLVVDTGMHYMDWTRQRAIDFMVANTALTVHNITTEVDRYISWPGQALAYKMGELKIRELRALAESKLGGDFDVRAFHGVVLGSGAVPLNVLEVNVKRWIDDQS